MLTKFWEKAGEGLAGLWSSWVLTPAAAFWGMALLAWVQRNGFDKLTNWIQTLDPTVGVVLLIVLVFLLTVSAELAQQTRYPMLRYAEGYWPGWLDPLRGWLADRAYNSYQKLYAEWETFDQAFSENGDLPAHQAMHYARLSQVLSGYPTDRRLFMPTGFGNRLRAVEEYPQLRYGLDTDLVWPRFWLVIPKTTRKELASARRIMDEAALLLFWGILFLAWIWLSAWVIVPSLLVVIFAAWQLNAAAESYGQLVRAALDLHRFELYDALHWPRPKKPAEETAQGAALCQYLRYNKSAEGFEFTSGVKQK
jgi:hypothetical protein